MARHVAVPVRRPLPHTNCREVRRLQRCHVPLVDAVVRYAVEADLAVRPPLYAGPFDAVKEVLGLARREVVDYAGRAAAAARIDAHARIVVRHPLLGIDHLPVLILVGRARGDVRMLLRHALPCARIALLKREPLGIGAVAEDHGKFAHLRGSIHIGPQHQPVVHRDRDVPVDMHTVAKSAARRVRLAPAAARRVLAQGHELLLKPKPPARAEKPFSDGRNGRWSRYG